jgi:hypothetical protein
MSEWWQIAGAILGKIIGGGKKGGLQPMDTQPPQQQQMPGERVRMLGGFSQPMQANQMGPPAPGSGLLGGLESALTGSGVQPGLGANIGRVIGGVSQLRNRNLLGAAQNVGQGLGLPSGGLDNSSILQGIRRLGIF